MELKTKINAEEGKHDILITREFDLPVDLLFRAHTEAEFLTQWMGTTVLKLETKKHGSYEYETKDPQGNVVFKAHGTFHDVVLNQKIVRTFEMEGTPFGVQLEVTQLESLTSGTSRLTTHSIYESVEHRDQLLKMPFAQGINYAHNRLEETLKNK